MFILRTVGGPDKPQCNILLGKFYNISYYDSEGYLEKLKELRYKVDESSEKPWGNVYAIIHSELHHPFGILEGDSNYIMTGDGKTFENISLKR